MLDELRKMMMRAKLERDSLKSNLLSTLIAEAIMIGKNDGDRETTEAEIVNTIKKFLKNVNENLLLLKELGKEQNDALREKEILESLLPKQMNEAELEAKILEIIAEIPESLVKTAGNVMSELKKRCDGRYEGKEAFLIVKKLLSK